VQEKVDEYSTLFGRVTRYGVSPDRVVSIPPREYHKNFDQFERREAIEQEEIVRVHLTSHFGHANAEGDNSTATVADFQNSIDSTSESGTHGGVLRPCTSLVSPTRNHHRCMRNLLNRMVKLPKHTHDPQSMDNQKDRDTDYLLVLIHNFGNCSLRQM